MLEGGQKWNLRRVALYSKAAKSTNIGVSKSNGFMFLTENESDDTQQHNPSEGIRIRRGKMMPMMVHHWQDKNK